MNHFLQKLMAHDVPLTRGRFETLQINVGRKCNQVCTHCHVDAGPHRTEMMTEEVAHKVGAHVIDRNNLMIASIAGLSSPPRSVSEYSTVGGEVVIQDPFSE